MLPVEVKQSCKTQKFKKSISNARTNNFEDFV